MKRDVDALHDRIDEVVIRIMMNDGPDGHIDGHHIITMFICDLLKSYESDAEIGGFDYYLRRWSK